MPSEAQAKRFPGNREHICPVFFFFKLAHKFASWALRSGFAADPFQLITSIAGCGDSQKNVLG